MCICAKRAMHWWFLALGLYRTNLIVYGTGMLAFSICDSVFYNNITIYRLQLKFFFFKYFSKLTIRLFTTNLHLFWENWYIIRYSVAIIFAEYAYTNQADVSSLARMPPPHVERVPAIISRLVHTFLLSSFLADRTRRVCQSSIL